MNTPTVSRLIVHSWHKVKVHMWMIRVLGKLDHIRLSASHDCLERQCNTADQWSQLVSLLVGQLIERFDVTMQYQNELSRQGCVECVCDIPILGLMNAVP